jgi:hypothetical protein
MWSLLLAAGGAGGAGGSIQTLLRANAELADLFLTSAANLDWF